MSSNEPAIVFEYTDPLEKFKGWLVIDGIDKPLCAGGCRVQKNLTGDALKKMARNMTRKMQVWGMPINGAKCGIDYDPSSSGKDAAVKRFMQSIKPFLLTRYSMGGDMNTRMAQLEATAKSLDIPSIKMAIANAQQMDMSYYEERYAILDQPAIGDWTLGKLRAGYGVGVSALALLDEMGIPHNKATAAVQGFGTLAKASMVVLQQAGVKVRAIGDVDKCISATGDNGLDLESLLTIDDILLPDTTSDSHYNVEKRQAVLETACDVLLLEAIENAVTSENMTQIKAGGIVPGANLAVSAEAEQYFLEQGIPVLPCFVAGSGGSVAMNGLFGPKNHPTPQLVLDHIKDVMSEMVGVLVDRSRKEKITQTQIALQLCEKGAAENRAKPYAV